MCGGVFVQRVFVQEPVWTCDEDWVTKCMDVRIEGKMLVRRPRKQECGRTGDRQR